MNIVAITYDRSLKQKCSTFWYSVKKIKLSHWQDTDQHDSQVDGDDGFEEEGLEVVGHVRDDDEEQGWDVHSEDGAQQSPSMT